MADFFQGVTVTDNNFIRGAARFMWAGTTIAFPTTIGDVINLSSYVAQTGWNDLGATKTGVTITKNNTEETFDVDQILTDIDTRPVTYTQTIATALAQVDPAHIDFAWEGGGVTGTTELRVAVGSPSRYLRRRLAVLFLKDNGKIRMHAFRKCQKSPQDSALAFNKTGEQQSLPVLFTALADTSVSDLNEQVQVIFDQV